MYRGINKIGCGDSHPIIGDGLSFNYVPFDYIKAELINFDVNLLLNNENLKFASLIDESTGEIIKQFTRDGKEKQPKRIAVHKGLVFQYYLNSQKVFISGSLHAYSNHGDHNHNDFSLSAFLEVLKELETDFNILPNHVNITQLEWGVNINPPICPNQIINHSLFHKWQRFENRIDNKTGKYHQSVHTDYILKLYNKGLQFGTVNEILRFERKQLNYLKFSKSIGIGQTLQDLIDSDFKSLKSTLLTNWNEILFFDPLMHTESKNVFKYRDVLTWEYYSTKSRKTRNKHFNKLREYNIQFGGDIQSKVSQIITDKLIELNKDVVTFSFFSYISNSLPPNQTQPTKLCQLTSIDISMQKEESFLLSHTGLKYYLSNNIEVFEKIKKEYLTRKWIGTDINIQVKEIAHNIRTKYNQKLKKNEKKYIESTYQYGLFDNKLNRIIPTHWGMVA